MTNLNNLVGFYKCSDYILTPVNDNHSHKLKLLRNEAPGAKKAIFQLIYIEQGSPLNDKRLTGLYLHSQFKERTIYKGDLNHIEEGFNFLVVVDSSGIIQIKKQ